MHEFHHYPDDGSTAPERIRQIPPAIHILIKARCYVISICAADQDYLSYPQVRRAPESTWLVSEGEVNIILAKAEKGKAWTCVFQGHDAISESEQSAVLQVD